MAFEMGLEYYLALSALEYCGLDYVNERLQGSFGAVIDKRVLELGSRDGWLLLALSGARTVEGVEGNRFLSDESRRASRKRVVYDTDPLRFEPVKDYDFILSIHDPAWRTDFRESEALQSSLSLKELQALLVRHCARSGGVILHREPSDSKRAKDFSQDGAAYHLVREEVPRGNRSVISYTVQDLSGNSVHADVREFFRYNPDEVMRDIGLCAHVNTSYNFARIFARRAKLPQLEPDNDIPF